MSLAILVIPLVSRSRRSASISYTRWREVRISHVTTKRERVACFRPKRNTLRSRRVDEFGVLSCYLRRLRRQVGLSVELSKESCDEGPHG